jgi:sporulation protein YlmC with PRC-barrel domain
LLKESFKHAEADMRKLALAATFLLVIGGGAFAQAPESPQPTPEATQPKPPASPEVTQPAPASPEAIQPATPAPEASKPTPSVAPKGAELTTVVPGDSVSLTEYYKQNVYDPSDNIIGEVSDVLLDKDGHVTAVILSVGGFLGLGAKNVSVPFNALRVTEKEGKRYLVIDTTKEALTSAPGYQYDKASGKWVPEAK